MLGRFPRALVRATLACGERREGSRNDMNVVPFDGELSRSWVRLGAPAGVLAVVAYIGASALPLPERLAMLLAFAFGPLLSVAFVGFYFFLRTHRDSPALQLATLFGVIGGTLVNLMLVVQQALFMGIPADARRAMGPAWAGLNQVQLGIDVSWDIYIAAATILLGLALARHPRFGPVLASITSLIGALLLVLNLWTFPTPPVNAGLLDVGPLVGLWYLVLSVRVWTSLGWWAAHAGVPARPGTESA